ncbi:MAG: HypC/HybG/HupF family hydrogenase formation chaperone [Acidimicrobiaceae bacterium]|nr:HypC/HybG/HupF family hydrogenase formation chaperone [Acidimicrobiaceae bacterium]
MCVSVLAKVLEVDGPVAWVDIAGQRRGYNALLFPEVTLGDRVLVHAGMVIQILDDNEAEEVEAAIKELQDIDKTWGQIDPVLESE